jgi:plasmid rolling circle replication initiator protein Rep
MVAQLQSKQSTPSIEPFIFTNGFNFVNQPRTSPKIEVCPGEKKKLRYKQNLAGDTIAALCRSSDNPLLMAQAVRIERCNSDDNLFVAEDLNTSDGELHDGKGSLWACNSRLCPNCTGKLSRRSRKIIRFVMENQKLLTGENWYFVTFTMPNLNLKSLPLPVIAEIMQTAWKRFSTLETRAGRKPTWFQKTIRGGFKNAEFTYTTNDVYNYHLHSLFVARSRIQDDGFVEIRESWTKALRFAFKKFDVELQINSKDGLAVVNVKKVEWTNREKVINELAKYVTKNDSWSKIPIDQLETIVAVPRFWRMFESFGVCRQTAREMREKTLKTSAIIENESVNQSANVNKDAYLDTKNLINSELPTYRKVRRVAWRIRVKEVPLWQYKIELSAEIEAVQRFRREQLQKKFSFATFQTLDGKVF